MKPSIYGAMAAFFARADTVEWDNTHRGATILEQSPGRHQTRKLEKSRRRMRKASQRANR